MVRMQPAHSKGAAAPSRSTAVQLLLQPAAARRSAPAPFCRRTCVLVEARRGGGSSSRGGGSASYPMRPSTPAVTDRIIACIPYLLPFLDTFMYGRYLFYQLPLLRTAIQPILPALALYHSIPFAPLVCFFGVYIGLVNNRSMSRCVLSLLCHRPASAACPHKRPCTWCHFCSPRASEQPPKDCLLCAKPFFVLIGYALARSSKHRWSLHALQAQERNIGSVRCCSCPQVCAFQRDAGHAAGRAAHSSAAG